MRMKVSDMRNVLKVLGTFQKDKRSDEVLCEPVSVNNGQPLMLYAVKGVNGKISEWSLLNEDDEVLLSSEKFRVLLY